MSQELGALHLVRKANGASPFERFLDSYRSHPAGTEHELVLLLKGFDSSADSAPVRALAADVTDRWIGVEDSGYDIGSYLAAARRLPHQSLCLLNSFSVIVADNWLSSLSAAHAGAGVGLVGATGSWGSPLTQLRFELGLGGLYAVAQADRRSVLRRMRQLAEAAQGPAGAERVSARKLRTARSMARRPLEFPPFPNHHVRTNAFVIDRDLLLSVRAHTMRGKHDTWRFESGRDSLTRQVEATGLRALVVGRDGLAYGREEWAMSETFWQGNQGNLLVADNQTDSYRDGDPELRAVLSAFAWGLDAAPVGTRRP